MQPLFCEAVQPSTSGKRALKQWQDYQHSMRQKLDTVKEETAPFEGRYVQSLQDLLPEQAQLLISNSMAIRDVDYFWRSRQATVRLFGKPRYQWY